MTIDAAGRSKFYGAGTQYNGTGRSTDVGSREWSIKGGKPADGKIAGSVNYRGRGTFEFTLPVFAPKSAEVSESDVMDGQRYAEDRRTPTEAELTKAYTEMRKAALAKDLKAMLELQGFDAKQVQAIRGLPGIDGELAAHADRFLDPGTPEEPTLEPGYAGIGARGKNSQGQGVLQLLLLRAVRRPARADRDRAQPSVSRGFSNCLRTVSTPCRHAGRAWR